MSKQLPISEAFPFLPYGTLNQDFMRDILEGPAFPPDWQPGAPDRAEQRRTWNEWFKETVRLISDKVWPQFNPDPASPCWEGEAADTSRMESLTRADLDLMARMRVRNFLDEKPTSPVRSADCPVHSVWYREEDGSNPFVANHRFYDTTVSEPVLRLMRAAYFHDHFNKESGNVGSKLQQVLQRPRPNQMALALGYRDFTHETARTSLSPSASSGHALQGLMGVGGVVETLLLKEVGLSEEAWMALLQYGVDIGDRRVFAGVHYPSDNIVSWIIALRIANHVYRNAEVKRKLWQAISQQSLVYIAISEAVSDGKGDAFKPGLELLASLMGDARSAGAD